MTLRTRLTVIVAVIVAVAVVGGAYAAHVSAQHALDEETDKFLRERAAGFSQRPPDNGGGYFPGPNDFDGDDGRFFQFDAVQQTIDRDGTVTNSLPNQPKLPVDAADRAIARDGGDARLRDVTVDGENYRMITVGCRRPTTCSTSSALAS
jgi:two-component system sensor histidine kinase MprB